MTGNSIRAVLTWKVSDGELRGLPAQMTTLIALLAAEVINGYV